MPQLEHNTRQVLGVVLGWIRLLQGFVVFALQEMRGFHRLPTKRHHYQLMRSRISKEPPANPLNITSNMEGLEVSV